MARQQITIPTVCFPDFLPQLRTPLNRDQTNGSESSSTFYFFLVKSSVRLAGRDGADPNFLRSDGAHHGGDGGVRRVCPAAETRTGRDRRRGPAGEDTHLHLSTFRMDG